MDNNELNQKALRADLLDTPPSVGFSLDILAKALAVMHDNPIYSKYVEDREKLTIGDKKYYYSELVALII